MYLMMKKTIYSKFDKRLITALPAAQFPGRIITVISEADADKAVDYLLSCDILGVDTETSPTFHKLNDIGMPASVIRLLEDRTVPKIGLSWHDDILSLHRRSEFEPGYFIDLQDIVGKIGIKDLSLQKLYANIFHQKISKRQRLTNWEAGVLTDKQKQYAATDAWTCIKLYEEIRRLYKTKEYKLVVPVEPSRSEGTPTEKAMAKLA